MFLLLGHVGVRLSGAGRRAGIRNIIWSELISSFGLSNFLRNVIGRLVLLDAFEGRVGGGWRAGDHDGWRLAGASLFRFSVRRFVSRVLFGERLSLKTALVKEVKDVEGHVKVFLLPSNI